MWLWRFDIQQAASRLGPGGHVHAEAVMRKQVAAIVAGVLIIVILAPAIYTIMINLRT